MPRIKSVRVTHFNEVQDISDDRKISITSRPNDDLLAAVESDYIGGMSYLPSSSDIGHAFEEGFGYVAAGMLSGATECAHVDAVCAAHHFNGTFPLLISWHPPLALQPADPRGDIYRSPQWEAWESFHREHGTVCPGCEAVNYRSGEVGGGIAHARCDNCLSPMAEGWPAGYEASEFGDVMTGYVTALLWTDVQRNPFCPDCGETMTDAYDSETSVQRWSCDDDGCDRTIVSDEEVERQQSSGELSGGLEHSHGVADLSDDARAEIRSDVDGFMRSNYADLHAYVEIRSYDPGEGSVWSYVGHDLYLSAASHGTGFWDRGTGEIGDRLHASSKPYTVPNLYLDSEGVIG